MISGIAYANLDVQIQRAPDGGGYRLMVQSSGGDSVRAPFELPFSEHELENFILKAGPARRGIRGIETQEMEAAKRFGAKLYDALFTADVRSALQTSLDQARQRGAATSHRRRAGVRIRLRLADVPELSGVPWEYLYNPTFNQFLALSTETPLVRYLDLPERTRPFRVSPPLRIILMVAGPSDLPSLNVRQEWQNLSEALSDLRSEGLVQVDVMETPTMSGLQRQLRRGEYHIFHFIGHGSFDRQTDEGMLAFEDNEGKSRMVSGQDLAMLLHDHPSLRLAVLNACEGAHTTSSDPFGGVAQRLVQGGLPAVAAMQFDITDEAAIAFAHEFYRSVADGYPIDAAATEARKIIFTESRGTGLEWGTPTLYMRSPDGQIFNVQRRGARGQPAEDTVGTTAPLPLPDPVVPAGAASLTTAPLSPDVTAVEEADALRATPLAAADTAALASAAVTQDETAPAQKLEGRERGTRRRVALFALAGLLVALIAVGAVFASGALSQQAPPDQAAQPGANRANPAAVGGAAGAVRTFGAVSFTDRAATLDEVTLAVEGLPAPPAGKQYEAWLLGAGSEQRRTIGVLKLDAQGNGEVSVIDSESHNLLATYDSYQITAEPDPDSSPLPDGDVVFAGTIAPMALDHIRHLLVSFPSTPDKIGLTVGLLQQAKALNTYAQEALAAQQAGDLAKLKVDAEAMVNLIEGKLGQHFGDVNGDGVVTSKPADEFGLLLNGENIGYIQGTVDHSGNAARAPDATENIKLHADHVGESAKNLDDWAIQIRDLCLSVAGSDSTEAVKDQVLQVSALADRLLNGKDLDGNETIDPMAGEGGTKTAYQHAQYMANVLVQSKPDADSASTGAPGSSVQPTPAGSTSEPPTGVPSGSEMQHPTEVAAAATSAPVPAVSPTAVAVAAEPSAVPATATAEPTAVPPTPTIEATAVPTEAPTAVAANPPGEQVEGRLVFEDNFDSGPGMSGLEDEGKGKESSRGFHSPGVYHFKLAHPDEVRYVVLPRLAAGDFTLELEIWDNSDDFAGSMSAGVIFRTRDRDHFYAFLLDSRGSRYTVRKYEAQDKWSDLIAWTPSDLIKGKAEHNMLRLDADGDKFSISLNGQPLQSFADGSYASGMLGMIAVNHDATTPHTHFDNLKVWSRDKTAEAAAPQVKDDPAGAMVLVRGGEFLMGGNERSDEWTNMVSLGDFYIDRTEVTNAAYARCVQAGACAPQGSPGSETHPSYANQEQFTSYPAIHVNWKQAAGFCAWAGKRLPTDAEWERAASWNAATYEKYVWPWGNVFDPAKLNSVESGTGDTSSAAQFPPELNGTFDMAGNVWEWTSSLYKPYPYSQTDGREDPNDTGDRVFRGGSWAQTQGKARAFVRQAASPTYSDREIGFRCAANP